MSNLIKKINRFNKPRFFFDIASKSKIVENSKFQSLTDLKKSETSFQLTGGIRTKSDEIFGNVGEGGYSLKHGYFKTIFNELKIRFDNKQNIFFLIYIFFGRTLMKIYKSLMFK